MLACFEERAASLQLFLIALLAWKAHALKNGLLGISVEMSKSLTHRPCLEGSVGSTPRRRYIVSHFRVYLGRL